MPREEPIPPLDAILDGSGVRYYSKRTRALTSLEKKLVAAREAFDVARKEQGLPEQPKLFHNSGAAPARAPIAVAAPAVSSAALRRQLRRQAIETGGSGGGSNSDGVGAVTAAAGLSAVAGSSTPATAAAEGAGSSGGGVGTGGLGLGPRARSGRDSDFQRFSESLVGAGRGPVVKAQPYHTQARTFFNLSLLPSSVSGLAGDSGLYYLPAAVTRYGPGPGAKGLRQSMLRYYQPDLALEREEKERATQLEMAARLSRAQDALGEHIQSLVARWGPGFLDRLTAAVEAEASGEAGRSSGSRSSGLGIIVATAAAAAGGSGSAAGGGGSGGSGSGKHDSTPVKLHLSAGGAKVPISAADEEYEFEHYKPGKAAGRARRSSSSPPVSGAFARLTGLSSVHISAATMERLSYLSEQLKVPVEQIMTLIRKPASAGEARTSPSSTSPKRLGGEGGGGGGSGHVVGVAGAHQSRRIELLPSRPTGQSSPLKSGAPSAAVLQLPQGAGGTAPPTLPNAADGLLETPFASPEATPRAFGAEAEDGAASARRRGGYSSVQHASGGSSRKVRGKDKEREGGRNMHLVVAVAAQRVRQEARAEAAAAREAARAAAAVQAAADAGFGVRAETSLQLVAIEVPRGLPGGMRDGSAEGGACDGPAELPGGPGRSAGRVVMAPPVLQVWSAFPSRTSHRPRTRSHASVAPSSSASASPSPSPGMQRTAAAGDGVSGGGAAAAASPPVSPAEFHHPSGLSYVSLGGAMPVGPTHEGLQPEDPRQGELEAASRAALESLARRHGDSRRHGAASGGGGGGATAGASRAGSASTSSRPGTSSGVGERGGGGSGQSQRRNRSRPSSRLSKAGGGAEPQRRSTFGGTSPGRVGDGGGGGDGDGGGGGNGSGVLRFSDRESGGDDDDGTSGRLRGAVSRRSARSGRGSKRGRTSPTSGARSSLAMVLSTAAGAPGSYGEEVILATDRAAGGGRLTSRRSAAGEALAASGAAAGDGGDTLRSGLRRLSEMAGSVGLRVGTSHKHRTSSPRSPGSAVAGTGPGTAGLLDSSDDDSTYGGVCGGGTAAQEDTEEEGKEEDEGLSVPYPVSWGGSRPSTAASAGVGGRLTLTWDAATIADAADAAAAAGSRPGSTLAVTPPLPQPQCQVLSADASRVSSPQASPADTVVAAAAAPVAAAALDTKASASSARGGGTGAVSAVSADAGSSPPALSRHYKLAGSRWNPTAPGALRPGYGTEADYVAGTYNPELMEKVAAARDAAALAGEEVPVDYKSPVQASIVRISLPSVPLAAAAAVQSQRQPAAAAAAAGATAPPPAAAQLPATAAPALQAPVVRSSVDLSLLTPEGRAAAANAKAARAIADVLNPVTRAFTNRAALAGVTGAEFPPPLQVLGQARAGTDGSGGGSGGNGTASAASSGGSRAVAVQATVSPVVSAGAAVAGRSPAQSPQLPAAAVSAASSLARHLIPMLPRSPGTSADVASRRSVVGSGRLGAAAAGVSPAAATAIDPSQERVASRLIRPSQSVWGRAESDELDILLPLNMHLSQTASGAVPSAAAATGNSAGGPRRARHPFPGARRQTAGEAPSPAPLGGFAAAVAEPRASTAPGGQHRTMPPRPEPRLWRGDPLALKAAFPKGEKVYRLVTDVTANARLLRDIERDLTPVEFRSRQRRGAVL